MQVAIAESLPEIVLDLVAGYIVPLGHNDNQQFSDNSSFYASVGTRNDYARSTPDAKTSSAGCPMIHMI
ncbi:MAG: hypothetical protein M3Y27_03940, partial [Acidobacteriota bacterium]|nr:hypothetical protein [Acidobacteriota bacterium]